MSIYFLGETQRNGICVPPLPEPDLEAAARRPPPEDIYRFGPPDYSKREERERLSLSLLGKISSTHFMS